jgi:hypothetical protein
MLCATCTQVRNKISQVGNCIDPSIYARSFFAMITIIRTNFSAYYMFIPLRLAGNGLFGGSTACTLKTR